MITEGEVINLQQEENGRKSIVLIGGKPYMLRKTPQFELYGNMLKDHEISQQDYKRSQTDFSKQSIEELKKQHKNKKVSLATKSEESTKKQEKKLDKKEKVIEQFFDTLDKSISEVVTNSQIEENKEVEVNEILDSFNQNQDIKGKQHLPF